MRTSFTIMTVAAVLGSSLAACGGGEKDVARFTGTWHPTSGTSTFNCPDETSTDSVSGDVRWSRGVSADLVHSHWDTCVINADTTGDTATGSGPPCSFSNGQGGTITLTFTTYTFVISPDGRTAQENFSASDVFSAGGASESCKMSETASYQKIGE